MGGGGVARRWVGGVGRGGGGVGVGGGCSAERGTQQLYPKNKGKGPEEVVEWTRQVAAEWRYLYSKAS